MFGTIFCHTCKNQEINFETRTPTVTPAHINTDFDLPDNQLLIEAANRIGWLGARNLSISLQSDLAKSGSFSELGEDVAN